MATPGGTPPKSRKAESPSNSRRRRQRRTLSSSRESAPAAKVGFTLREVILGITIMYSATTRDRAEAGRIVTFQQQPGERGQVGERQHTSPDRAAGPDRAPVLRLHASPGKAISDTGWARLVVQASKTPNEFGRSVRDNLRAEIDEAIALGHVTVQDPELVASIFAGIWLRVTRGILEQVAPPELSNQALEAALRAIGRKLSVSA